MTSIESARENLAKYFGFAKFKQGQADVIQSVLNGVDTVGVMSTGGGKSLCYQLPATLGAGVTLVISPLIALMKDQVDALAVRGIHATFVNSSLGYREVLDRLKGIRDGRYKIVYVAPERFRNEAFVRTVSDTRVSLLAVDEAHCISHWGHDFRPDYLRLRDASRLLGRPPIVALTAAATAQVRQDIIEQLNLTEPRVFLTGFDRPNLALCVVHTASEKQKLEALKAIMSRSTESGIIYTATRKSAEQVTSRLKMAGLSAEAYHGGMSDDERTRAQTKFMTGEARAIVATNAFGMGIDKPDIRFVVHYHVPGSIEQYYQEIGRAGRDDAPAQCTLLFNYADTRTQQFFIDGSNPRLELIERVYHAADGLARENPILTVQQIAVAAGCKNEMSVRSALALLEKSGLVERGRLSETTALASLMVTVEDALGAVAVPSIEATVLDDLVFGRSISEREDIELDLGAIAAGLGFSVSHVRNALGALARRGILRYRNAFRGPGIRMAKTAISEIQMDRAELANRANRGQSKLRKMVEYCYSKACLRHFVLDYFGDPNRIGKCGVCSSCSTATPPPARHSLEKTGVLTLKNSAGASIASCHVPMVEVQHTPAHGAEVTSNGVGRSAIQGAPEQRSLRERLDLADLSVQTRMLTNPETMAVKTVLTCVARLNNRFGKGTIARVLAGAPSGEISTHALDRTPSFGALRDESMSAINRYIKALICAGCVEVKSGQYPTLRISDLGREVMHGRTQVLLDLDKSQEM